MKDQLVGKKDQNEDDETNEEKDESNVIEFSDLNMGTQFYMGSLSVIGLYILYKLLLKTK
jgi:hypothetical protein